MTIHLRSGLFATLVIGAAFAQETSDLQPAAPQPPPGYSGAFYPGMPQPAINPPPAAGGESGARGKGESRERGLILTDENYGSDEGEPEVSVEGPTNNTHVVRRGDTLWGVSASYFRNPWYWPKLWALNPSITNPHWIYPGDILKLSAGGAAEPAPEPSHPSSEPALPKLTGRAAQGTGLYLRQNGFVEPGELEQAGKLIGSKEEKTMLATLDEGYVQINPKQPLVIGEKYTIYKPVKTVKHPVTGKRLGEIVEIFGEAQVKSITDGKIAKILITDSLDTIERGYFVGPLRRTFKLMDPKPADRDMEAVVVATLHPIQMLHADTIIFIDRGAKDGVELGNRFTIVRRGDGYEPTLWRGDPIDDKRFPREVFGTVQVVDLRDRLATGWVLRSTRETRIGDRVELHRGE